MADLPTAPATGFKLPGLGAIGRTVGTTDIGLAIVTHGAHLPRLRGRKDFRDPGAARSPLKIQEGVLSPRPRPFIASSGAAHG